MIGFIKINLTRFFTLIVCWILIFNFNLVFSKPDSDCKAKLQQAEGLYLEAEFESAISIITECLGQTGLAGADIIQANLLKGKIYQSLDSLTLARKSLFNIFEINATYQVDEIKEPPTFITFFNSTFEEWKKSQAGKQPTVKPPLKKTVKKDPATTDSHLKKKGSKKWYWIVPTVVVVGGGVLYALIGRSSDNEPDKGSISIRVTE